MKRKATTQATRLASGDYEYRGFTVSQDYRTKRWVAVRDDSPHAPKIFWANTLRSAKIRIDDCLDVPQS